MVSTQRIALALGLVLSGLGCGDPEPEDSVGDDTGEVALGELTGDLLMIAQVAEASVLFADYPSGTVVGERCLSELVPEECSGEPGFTCLLFEIEHVPAAKDTLSMIYAHRNPEVEGQPSSLIEVGFNRPAMPDWRLSELNYTPYFEGEFEERCAPAEEAEEVCWLNMAHTSTPVDDEHLVFADTRSARIVFAKPDRNTGELEVRSLLEKSHPDWQYLAWVNHLEVFEEQGHRYLLSSFKAGGMVSEGQRNAGRIVLWDITDLDAIQKVWTYPESGYLSAPHKSQRVMVDGESFLIYAHSMGASESFVGENLGSVGIARFSLEDGPTYLGDWRLAPEDGELGFLRDVEVLPDSKLLLTDSGCESLSDGCQDMGEIVVADWPTLPDPSGLSGSFEPGHVMQTFYELEAQAVDLVPSVRFAYETDFVPRESLVNLGEDLEFGRCP